MPPKKDDPGTAPEGDEGEEERELIERELAIAYLKSKLGKYQQSRDSLAGEVAYLVAELEKEKSDHRAIIDLLTQQAKASTQRMEEMTAQKDKLTKELEDVRKQMKKELEELRAEKDARISELEDQTEKQQHKLKELEEFTRQKETLQKELETEKQQRAQDERKWREEKTTMERHFVQEKDRWQKELQHQIKETKAQMMKLMDNQLEITTKRTIMENEQMHAELAYQSRQSEKIAARNKQLGDENADLRRRVELAKQTEVELAKRNHVYQKTIKTLLAKIRSETKVAETEQKEAHGLQSHVELLDSRVHALSITCQELNDQLRAARDHAVQLEEEHDLWMQRQGAAALFLMQSIEDIASLEPDHVDHSMRDLATRAQESWASMTPEDRTALLRKLLLSMQVVDPSMGGGGAGKAGTVDRLVLPPVTHSRTKMSMRQIRGTSQKGMGDAGDTDVRKSSSKRVVATNKWLKGERGSEIMYGTVPGVEDLLEAVTSGKADFALLSMRHSTTRPRSANSMASGPKSIRRGDALKA